MATAYAERNPRQVDPAARVTAPGGSSTSAMRRGPGVPAWRFLAGWLVAWALVGGAVGAGIRFTLERPDAGPVWLMSILFAEVVGFTALVSARTIFPLFASLPFTLRLGLQSLTLFAGTLFGSAAILWLQPLFSLARLRTVVVIVLVNASLAVVVGIALHTYDTMRGQIEASFETLRRKEALEREIEIAREVQRELLPRAAPRAAGIELAGVCIPAVGVGGDYYDFLSFADRRIGMVIADVSGKGIPAALLMAGLQASVRSLGLSDLPPREVNRRLNDILYESTSPSRYATFFFCLYDPLEGALTYSNAGHLPPLVLTSDGVARLSSGGLPIGVFGGSRYDEDRRTLARGDLLALFTDGVVETPGPSGEEFGEQRLLSVLSEHRGESLDRIIEAVMDTLSAWGGDAPRHDDVTLVLARKA